MAQSDVALWDGDTIVREVAELCERHQVAKEDVHFILLGVACRFAEKISQFNDNELILVDPFHVD